MTFFFNRGFYRNSELVGPSGNVTARGILNQLGRPRLSILEVLVREAVQNSWDARNTSSSEPVTFGISAWRLDSQQRELMRREIFSDLPPAKYLPLKDYLDSPNELLVLALYDRGTVGLGGPTRADVFDDESPRDFVDFLRNVGQPPDKKLAGGTYGYGKAAFYRASLAHTILVHTRCVYKNQLQSRLIAAALGDSYLDNGRAYTGRHWWGKKTTYDGLNIAEPILDKDADELAEKLGLPSFVGDDCGTSILILQPILEETEVSENIEIRTSRETINLLAEYLLWYFWPKMLDYEEHKAAMRFEVFWEGQEIDLPNPFHYPPLRGFAQALYRIQTDEDYEETPYRHRLSPIFSYRPKKLLGKLALQQFPVSSEQAFDTGSASNFSHLKHHTALMRIPELVVKYIPGSPLPHEDFAYAGVFITDEDVDKIFANAEPPTHDDWVAEGIEETTHKTFIRVSLRRIHEEMENFAKPATIKTTSPNLTPLGEFSNQLGASLLPSEMSASASARSSYRQSLSRQSTFPSQAKPSLSPYRPYKPSSDISPDTEFQSTRQSSTEQKSSPNHDSHETLFPPAPLPPAPIFQPTIPRPQISSYQESSEESEASTRYSPPPRIQGYARVFPKGSGDFVLVDEEPALQVCFTVEHAKYSVGTVIGIQLEAVLDGATSEKEPPLGGSQAQVIRWISPTGEEYAGSSELFISANSDRDWFVIVSLPDDIMLGIELTADAKAAE